MMGRPYPTLDQLARNAELVGSRNVFLRRLSLLWFVPLMAAGAPFFFVIKMVSLVLTSVFAGGVAVQAIWRGHK